MVIVVLVTIALAAIIVQAFLVTPPATMKLAKLPAGEYDPAVWGRYYPLEYKSYRKNLEMAPSPTGFGGGEKVQKSIKEPEILMNFKGMPFSKDYTEDRGHPYAVEDLKESKRVTPASVGACMTCKSANIIDIFRDRGWEYAKLPLADLYLNMKHPITCANCHDPATMKLSVANPAFVEAMERRGIDVKKATRQDMRSYVCGQCHSEYYFEPATKRVVFPWDKGYLPEQMYAYYAEKPSGFEQDWVHPDSQAKMLKAQHPDFETWADGVHAKSGVACADCHMPFMLEKGRKYSSHWVTSPMKHAKESCMTCHTQDEKWLLERVKTEQNNVWQLQRLAGQAVARAHGAIGRASAEAGVDKERLDKARELVRQAQWFWDMVAAENGMGFHNPDQALNTLGRSIDMAHQAAAMVNMKRGTQF
ncbi:MAG: ammonia-forming cytochrome c nitrite reductase subunit c552 [Desulfobacterota bacterium]|jgi:nitrite reductase (cytochrome c-552)|nr:ammonia-forming cytochrome c nitrite reductase subunit c552 [Thermodesulfobacteriota bacterium]